MRNCDVSVIIPVYNVENYLCECIESVLAQTFTDYEIICIDDASMDNSHIILKGYENRYDNIHVITHGSNKGLSAARNTGLMHAKGKYVLFLDSDDMIKPETLLDLYREAKKKDTDIIYFNMEILYERGEEPSPPGQKYIYMEYSGVYTGQEMFCKFMADKTCKVEVWRQFFRKEFLLQNNLTFYEGILHEDNLFSFLCAMKANKVMNINKEYYVYRQRSGSITKLQNNKRAESLFVVMMEIFKYWNMNGFDESVNHAIEVYFMSVLGQYRKYKAYCDNTTDLTVGTRAEQILYRIVSGRYLDKLGTLSKQKMDILRGKDKIILFGAGRVAERILKNLINNQIIISAVAVSDKAMNPRQVLGIVVQDIEELAEFREIATVIIATASKFCDEIEKELKQLEFKDIVKLDYPL